MGTNLNRTRRGGCSYTLGDGLGLVNNYAEQRQCGWDSERLVTTKESATYIMSFGRAVYGLYACVSGELTVSQYTCKTYENE